jgi:hypothetical protein
MLSRIVLATAVLCAGGCSTFSDDDPTVVSASPSAVTLRFKEGNLGEATRRAGELCAVHGLIARMQRVSPAEGDSQIGNFDCIPNA